jgi:hypothetical protein
MASHRVRWIYILDVDRVYNIRSYLPKDWNQGYAFYDKNGILRMEISADGTVKVLAGYAWDGCTPKWSFFDLVVGVPDGAPNHETTRPKAYFASMFHDALCQFLGVLPELKRSQVDHIFFDILTRDDFRPRYFYLGALLTFGRFSGSLKRWLRKYGGSRRAPL